MTALLTYKRVTICAFKTLLSNNCSKLHVRYFVYVRKRAYANAIKHGQTPEDILLQDNYIDCSKIRRYSTTSGLFSLRFFFNHNYLNSINKFHYHI